MRGGSEILPQVFIFGDGFQRGGRAFVAVFADEFVVCRIFAELLEAGGENDKIAVVRNHHARAVNSFVAEPCGAEFLRIEIDDDLLDGSVHQIKISLLGELYAFRVGLVVIADEEAFHFHLACFMVLGHDGQQIDDGKILQVCVDTVVEEFANRRVRKAHEAFQTI